MTPVQITQSGDTTIMPIRIMTVALSFETNFLIIPDRILEKMIIMP